MTPGVVTSLIFRWFLDMVDNKNLDRSLSRFQLECPLQTRLVKNSLPDLRRQVTCYNRGGHSAPQMPAGGVISGVDAFAAMSYVSVESQSGTPGYLHGLKAIGLADNVFHGNLRIVDGNRSFPHG